MASTVMSASNSATIAKWDKKTFFEATQQATFGMLANCGAIYDASRDFKGTNGRGDNITFDYVNKLVNNPLGETDTVYGREEALRTNTHNMAINETNIAVSSPNRDTIQQQRTNIDFDEAGALTAAERGTEIMDTSVFNQLAGFNPTSFTIDGTTYTTTAEKLQVQGHNAPVSPTSNRIIRPASAASDQVLTSADTFRLDLLDYVTEKNMVNAQPAKPCLDGYYRVFISPEQEIDLMHDTSGKIQPFPIELAKISNGDTSAYDFKYSDGTRPVCSYKNFLIYSAPRVPNGVNGSDSSVITTVKRAVVVGRDALSYASPFGGLGKNEKDVPFKLKSELADYDRVKGMNLSIIYGLKKMSPANNQDIGSFVIPTYAASHS
jgi:hypothetical protein